MPTEAILTFLLPLKHPSTLRLPRVQREVGTILQFRIHKHYAPLPDLYNAPDRSSKDIPEKPFWDSPVHLNAKLHVQGTVHRLAPWFVHKTHTASRFERVQYSNGGPADNSDRTESNHTFNKRLHRILRATFPPWLFPVWIDCKGVSLHHRSPPTCELLYSLCDADGGVLRGIPCRLRVGLPVHFLIRCYAHILMHLPYE